jgi:tight adherence protein C
MPDALNAFLIAQFGPAGPLIAVAGLSAALLLACVPMALNRRPDPLDKLKDGGRKAAREENRAVLRERSKNEKLNRYAQFLQPQDAQELSAIRTKMLQAGYRGRDSVQLYYAAQVILAVGCLVLGTVYYFTAIDSPDAALKDKLMYILGPGAVGYLAPKYWIARRVSERQREIQHGFPDALDMMLVCVEAGQSMDQAIVRVAREMRASYPALADEFQIIAYEMRAGKEKSQVLSDMSDRCGVQDVSSFVTVLNQAATFGTSISDALRVYASEMRDKRVMRAEEAANKLPTKMTLVTMMLTVPPLLIILVGPSAVGISEMGNIGQ